MKKAIQITYHLSLVFLLSLNACSDHIEPVEISPVGTWDVQWSLDPTEGDWEALGIQTIMQGTAIFESSGRVTLTGYGQDNSIFLQKTEQSALHWTFKEGIIQLQHEASGFKVPYQLQLSGPDGMVGTFQGIQVTLQKRYSSH